VNVFIELNINTAYMPKQYEVFPAGRICYSKTAHPFWNFGNLWKVCSRDGPFQLHRRSFFLSDSFSNMDKRTKELFEWAATNSQTRSTETDPPVAPSTKLDPAIIDSILGPDDSQLMLESMQAIKDTSLDLDDR
jgi:hypothetical protein